MMVQTPYFLQSPGSLFSDQTFIFMFLKTLFKLVGFRYMGMILSCS